jgi:hypothetical protein
MPLQWKKTTSVIEKIHNRTRQEINEHIFGTIKRQWGYNHTNLTGLEKLMEHNNYVGLQHQTRYKHTHGSLIAKIKIGSHHTKQNLFCYYNDLF